MPRVVSHVEIEAVSPGGVLHVGPDTLVTPLARAKAAERGVTLAEGPADSTVRQIARQVIAKLPGASPETIEAVVSEILGAMSATPVPARSRAVLTVTGRNAKGICAVVTTQLAELGADILDISQTIVADFFTMILVFDIRELTQPFETASAMIHERLAQIGMKATVMHEDVLSSLHRV